MERNEIVAIIDEALPYVEQVINKSIEVGNKKPTIPEYVDPDKAEKKKPIGRWIAAVVWLVMAIASMPRDLISGGKILEAVPVVGVGVWLVLWALNAPKSYRKKAEKNNTLRESIQAQVKALEDGIYEGVKKVRETGIQDIIPEDYLSVEGLSMIRTYLANGRADTVKEALNLLEEELHRMRLEESAQNAANAARSAADSARSAAISTWINTINK